MKTSVGATWAWRQVRELVALGLDIHVALPPGPMVERYASAGASVHPMDVDLPLRQPQQVHRAFSNIRSLVEGVSPDLIHIHNVGPALAVRAALGRHHHIPRLFQVPGPLHLEHAMFRRVELASSGSHDWWIASCAYTERLYLQAGVPKDRIRVSYYGTDVANFPGSSSSAVDLRGDLGIASTTHIIGMVAYMYAPKRHLGQLRGLKGHEDLIEATAIGVETGADVAVVFVGGPWNGAERYEHRLRAMAARECGHRAFFLGTRTDVARLYPGFDVAVHPSLSENVGGAVESLLAEVPTVGTTVGGIPEVIRAQETGWLVPPHDPKSLWAAISEAISDPARARAMAKAGRTLVLDRFDVRRTSKQVKSIYEHVLSA